MNKPPATDDYQKLLKKISAIYDKAIKDVAMAVDSILKIAYREIGKVIVENEQKGSLRAKYGEHLLEQLSADLTATNRKGFSISNLKNMRQVYAAFSIRQISGELTWSHYVALSSIKDEKVRKEFQKKTEAKDWNVEELKQAMKAAQVLTLEDQSAEKDGGPDSASGAATGNGKIIRLSVKRGMLDTYKIIEELAPIEKSTQELPAEIVIDMGFFIYYNYPSQETECFKPGEIVSVLKTQDSYAFKHWEDPKIKGASVLYTFRAYVSKITDADTITFEVDCGFGLYSKQKLRLRGINAPEIATAQGQKARDFVVRRLKSANIVVKTYSTDIYDRFLADVFYLPRPEGQAGPAYGDVTANGIHLNQELVDQGLAEIWTVPNKEDLAFLN